MGKSPSGSPVACQCVRGLAALLAVFTCLATPTATYQLVHGQTGRTTDPPRWYTGPATDPPRWYTRPATDPPRWYTTRDWSQSRSYKGPATSPWRYTTRDWHRYWHKPRNPYGTSMTSNWTWEVPIMVVTGVAAFVVLVTVILVFVYCCWKQSRIPAYRHLTDEAPADPVHRADVHAAASGGTHAGTHSLADSAPWFHADNLAFHQAPPPVSVRSKVPQDPRSVPVGAAYLPTIYVPCLPANVPQPNLQAQTAAVPSMPGNMHGPPAYSTNLQSAQPPPATSHLQPGVYLTHSALDPMPSGDSAA